MRELKEKAKKKLVLNAVCSRLLLDRCKFKHIPPVTCSMNNDSQRSKRMPRLKHKKEL